MTPEEYADNHERRLTTSHQALMKGFIDGQEAFKSALREEIDKLNHPLPGFSVWRNGRSSAFKEVLELLDTVTPPKQ